MILQSAVHCVPFAHLFYGVNGFLHSFDRRMQAEVPGLASGAEPVESTISPLRATRTDG